MNAKLMAILPIVTLMVAMSVYAPNNASAASTPQLSAPTNLSCEISGTDLSANWDDVVSASKYSVEITADYESSDTQTFKFTEIGNTNSDFEISADQLLSTDLETPGEYPTSASIAVKGLNPPGKSQNNQFSPDDCGNFEYGD